MGISIYLAPLWFVKLGLLGLTIFISYYLFKVIPDKEEWYKDRIGPKSYRENKGKECETHSFFDIIEGRLLEGSWIMFQKENRSGLIIYLYYNRDAKKLANYGWYLFTTQKNIVTYNFMSQQRK